MFVKLRRKNRFKYLIEVITVTEKQHKHENHKGNSLFEKIVLLRKEKPLEIKVEPKYLYEVKGFFLLDWLIWLASGRSNHYIMIVNEKGEPITEQECMISGKVLKVARDWKGLGKAIEDAFGKRFEIPRVGLIAIIGLAIIVIMFLIWKGFIPVPESWGIQ